LLCIAAIHWKTVLLLGLLSGLLVIGGQAIGGRNGLYFGLVLAVVMNFAGYFFSDKIALASYSAKPVTPQENPEVYRGSGRPWQTSHSV